MTQRYYRRRGIIHNIERATGKTGADLMNHLQTGLSPSPISDNCVTIDDCDTEDLREAMRVICGH